MQNSATAQTKSATFVYRILFIAKTDKNLLIFLHELTKSVRSRRKLFHDSTPPDQEIKTIRLMFALSVLQLCTNNTCNVPFQIAVTESVICHGGQLQY